MNRTASRMAIVSAAMAGAFGGFGTMPPMRGFGPKHAKHSEYERRRRAKEREQIAAIEAERERTWYYAKVNGGPR